MVVNHDKKFVFVAVARTGSTSIRDFFNADLTASPDVYHATIYDIEKSFKICLSRADIDDYYKFAFVRNPWDRMVSSYFSFRQQDHRPWNENVAKYSTFKSFMNNIEDNEILSDIHFRPQSECLSINGHLAVDFIGKYDNYERDFKRVCEHIKMPIKSWEREMGHHRQTKGRSREDNYKFYYRKNPEFIDIVSEIYHQDIKYFNYSFDD